MRSKSTCFCKWKAQRFLLFSNTAINAPNINSISYQGLTTVTTVTFPLAFLQHITFQHPKETQNKINTNYKTRESFPRPPPLSLSSFHALSIKVSILGFNPRIVFSSVSEFIWQQNWLYCWSCRFYTIAVFMFQKQSWNEHLSLFPFPLWKSKNGTVGLEKQMKIIVCDCIMLLVLKGFKEFLLPDSSWLRKTGPPSQTTWPQWTLNLVSWSQHTRLTNQVSHSLYAATPRPSTELD